MDISGTNYSDMHLVRSIQNLSIIDNRSFSGKIIDLQSKLRFLNGEELLGRLISLSDSSCEKQSLKLLTKALCHIAYDFFRLPTDNLDRSIFRTPSGMKGDKQDSMHPCSIQSNNRLHQWHALRYWLSKSMPINEKNADKAIEIFESWVQTQEQSLDRNKTKKISHTGAALSYFFSFSRENPSDPVNLPAHDIQKLSLVTWLRFPRSKWFIMNIKSDDIPLRAAVINDVANFLYNGSYTKHIRFHQAIMGFSLAHLQTIELLPLCDLLGAIYHFATDTQSGDLVLPEKVMRLFTEACIPTWTFNDFLDNPSALQDSSQIEALPRDILNLTIALSRICNNKIISSNNFWSYKNRLINAYRALINPCENRCMNKRAKDDRMEAILKVTSLRNAEYLNDKIRSISKLEVKKEA